MDTHTTEQRHKNMQAIKCKDTKIEVLLRKELWSRGIRYRKNAKDVVGKPDIVFKGKKIAVFCCLGMYLFLSFRGVSCTIKNGV